MQQTETSDRKRQPLPAAESVPTKKRRTIEDAIRAAGLDPAQSSVNMSVKPTAAPPAAYPAFPRPLPQVFPTSCQFNNYISQNAFPLIANYFNCNILAGMPSRADVARPVYGPAPAPVPVQGLYHTSSSLLAPPPVGQQRIIPPTFMPSQQAGKRSGLDKPTLSTIEKALSHLAAVGAKERADILEDKSLPEAARRFVVRSLEKCANDPDREYMRMMLRRMLSTAQSSGQLGSKKWDDLEPPRLPREMIRPAPAAVPKPDPAPAPAPTLGPTIAFPSERAVV